MICFKKVVLREDMTSLFYLYKYVDFYFYGEKIIRNIKVQDVYQKNSWIIAKSEDGSIEYRFRIKDIEKIEYKM